MSLMVNRGVDAWRYESGVALMAHDLVEHENVAPFTMTAFGWWRTDVSAETNDAYWRDVHGPLAARIPGFFQYRQLHLAAPEDGLLTLPTGVEALPVGEPPDGIAQELFRTRNNLAAFTSHPFVTDYIFHDEKNLARRNATMPSAEGAARTLVDNTAEATPQGPPRQPTYAVCLQSAADRAQLHSHAAAVAKLWADDPGVLRLRFTLLDAYDATAWQSPGVDHAWAEAEQYQAWIEIVVMNTPVMQRLAAFDGAVVRGVHTYPVRAKHTIVFDSRPTDVGLRGWPAVKLIEIAGATNQQEPQLLRALYGDVVDGVRADPTGG
jgi:EthD domain